MRSICLILVTVLSLLSAAAPVDTSNAYAIQNGKSLIETLREARNFTRLLKALEEAGLTEMLSGEKSYTLLAPFDEAFSESRYRDLARDRKHLRKILLNHILPGKVRFSKLFAPDSPSDEGKTVVKSLKTVGGSGVEFICVSHYIGSGEHRPTINQAIGPEDAPVTRHARVIRSDIEARNGVIHSINSILGPNY